MIDGQLLYTDANTTTSVYGPWFPRPADNAIFLLEIIARHISSGDLTMEILHKNSEDTGTPATAKASIVQGAVGRHATTVTGLKELVRFKFIMESSDDNDAWALFRALQPEWYDSVKF